MTLMRIRIKWPSRAGSARGGGDGRVDDPGAGGGDGGGDEPGGGGGDGGLAGLMNPVAVAGMAEVMTPSR
jgi:hypothetical protein